MTTPPYRLIADDLRRRILDGDLAPGATVPSENALVEQYAVAAETARRALAVLAAEGLTEARRGSGTRVRTFQPILRQAGKRLSAAQWGSGRSIWQADLDQRPMAVDRATVTERPCPGRIAEALGLETGAPVWVRDRRYLVEDAPVMLATSYLPAAMVAGLRRSPASTAAPAAPTPGWRSWAGRRRTSVNRYGRGCRCRRRRRRWDWGRGRRWC